MKVVELTGGFGLDHLEVLERPTPRPGPGQALVRLRAASLNYRDLLVVGGSRQVPLPLVPLSDAAGEVVEVGKGVSRVQVGDRVAPTFVQGWISGPHPPVASLPTLGGPLPGVLAEYGVWDQEGLVKLPEFLGFEEAACLPCAAVSAWNALFVSGQVRPGDTVLLQGTGGVSLFALQFAKAAGARVLITSGSAGKLERALAMGADHGLNYRDTPEWGEVAWKWAGHGVDWVVEVGGADTLRQSLLAVRNAGQVSLVGFVSGTGAQIDTSLIGMKSIQIRGIRVGHRDSFEAMLRAVVQHGIRPVIEHTYGFGETARALAALGEARHFGKICIRI